MQIKKFVVRFMYYFLACLLLFLLQELLRPPPDTMKQHLHIIIHFEEGKNCLKYIRLSIRIDVY